MTTPPRNPGGGKPARGRTANTLPTPPESAPEAAVRSVDVVRWQGDGARRVPDRLAVEMPLEIRIGGAATVLLRTPGHDDELVAGFLWSEGIVTRADHLAGIRALPAGEVVTAEGVGGDAVEVTLAAAVRDPARRELVALGERRPRPPAERLFYASSSCGACGKTSLGALAVEAPPVTSRLTVEIAVLATLPDRMRAAQPGFAATGGLHAAALFTAGGELVALREDVGRHNAVDKLVGWALYRDRLPLADLVLQVSGRLGYEIVQKAIVAGVPVVAAVGAASTLAVALAERHGLTLATFVRAGATNVAGDAGRIVGYADISPATRPLG